MALATQCPHCFTSFRVANDQLKLHAGVVRCGACQQTFNGIEHLLAPGALPRTAAPSVNPEQAIPEAVVLAPTELIPTEAASVPAEVLDAVASSEPQAPTEENHVLEVEADTDVDTDTKIDTDAVEKVEAQILSSSNDLDFEFDSASDADADADADTEPMPLALESTAPLAIETEHTEHENQEENDQENSLVQPELSAAEHLIHIEHPEPQISDFAPSIAALAEHHTPEIPSEKLDEVEVTSSLEVASDDQLPHEAEDLNDDETPRFILQAEKQKRYGKWKTAGLSLAVLLSLTALGAQTAYYFRSTIVAHYPQVAPQFKQACQFLKCEIKLLAQKEMLEIGGSELLELNLDPRINALAVQLQNRSNTVQAWPMLELVLKDARGKPVIQRVFAPSDYLTRKEQIAKGMAANSENDLKLHFELSTLKVTGYTVEIFYP
ncbi:MAG: DUF3426 domain-containing protein [Undibacterium sp.]|nr:DUF3426 domain-containing protein [Undibacterium sp.]